MAINYTLRIKGATPEKRERLEAILPPHSTSASIQDNPAYNYVFDSPLSKRDMLRITKAAETLQIPTFSFYDSKSKRTPT